jgi:hypothetical protein
VRRAYLLVYSSTLGTREEIKACLDNLSQVSHWRHDLPNAFYVVSDVDAHELSKAITDDLGRHGRFLITEIGENYSGWLPSESWYVIKNKQRKPGE